MQGAQQGRWSTSLHSESESLCSRSYKLVLLRPRGWKKLCSSVEGIKGDQGSAEPSDPLSGPGS